MQRVVFIINSLEGGGAERVLALLIRECQNCIGAENIEFALILLDDCDVVQELPDNLPIRVIGADGSLVKSIAGTYRALRQLRPNLVISFLTRSNCASVIAARFLGLPVVISERVNTSSHFSAGLSASINRIMVRLIYPWANRVVAVSGGVADDLRDNYRVKESQLEIIYNAYDMQRLTRLAQEKIDVPLPENFICGMGRLVENKNFELLIRAYHKSEIEHPLVILGQGPQQAYLKSLCQSLGIAERVTFPGFQQNPYPFLSRAKFFVSSSNAEGFPNALAEAMVLGKAVVATNCQSGPGELIADDRNVEVDGVTRCSFGLLVPVNDVSSLAQAMKIMSDRSIRFDYEQASLKRAADFSVASFVDNYLKVFKPYLN